SSAAVYGQPDRLPVGETAPLRAISPYGEHRVVCETLLRDSGLPAVVARVFSAYGEGLRRQVLWDICAKAINSAEVALDGTGDESRDFVHAEDVAAAVVVLIRKADFGGEPYNVATGVETRIGELARL